MRGHRTGISDVGAQGGEGECGHVGSYLEGAVADAGGDVDGVVGDDPVHVLRKGCGPIQDQGS